jgi:SPP1 family phage portal protein
MGEISEVSYFGWGKVPFTPLFNNKNALSDLKKIKPQIDVYDVLNSDWANNLQELQEAILVLINRGAQDYEDFLKDLKKYKIIDIDDSSELGGASWLTLELPFESKDKFMEKLLESIYEDAQAVNTIKFGDGNITNIFIKSQYSDLDLKALKFEKMLTKFIKNYCEFYNIYAQMKNYKKIDINKLKITYNHKMIFNEVEKVENVQKSDGIISEKTNVKNHPWVTDVDDELLEIEKDRVSRQERQLEMLDGENNLNNNNGEEDE